jgi:hypothetical protein
MAGVKPSFITGANAKIKAGDITIAYAQDVSYNITVTTVPIESMGRYEVVSNEPVAYFVDGTLSVIRYTDVAAGLAGAAATGNGVGQWNFQNPAGTNAGQHFNPAEFLASETWDLEIFQKHDDGGGGISTTRVVKVKDCRLTRKGGGINKRGILVEQFAFNAILADDDSMTAERSGDIDLE